jgi:hypothetical protein
VVTWNPTIKASVTTGGNPLALEGGDRLEFHLPEGWTGGRLYIHLENLGGEARLGIAPLPGEDGENPDIIKRISVPAHALGWQSIDVTAEGLAGGFRLDASQLSGAIYLRGIRSDPDSLRNWPWDQGLTLIQQRSGSDAEAVEINFNTANLVPYSNWSLDVVDDQGDTVLIRVNR